MKAKKNIAKKRTSPPVRREKSAEQGKTRVYVVGDQPLVEEYVRLCKVRGFSVFYDFNTHCDDGRRPDTSGSNHSPHVPAGTSFALELTNVDLGRKRRNLEILDKALPASCAIVSSSVTVSATEQSSWIGHKSRLVGCSALPSLGDKPLIEIAPTVFSPAETIRIVERFFRSLGKEIELVQDRVGMVFPRILCQVINEASFALQEEIALPRDIDTAMKIGFNFPLGPIEWAEKIGLDQVDAILKALHSDLCEDRYRTAPILRQMAANGTWWHGTQAPLEERHSA